MKLVYSSLCFNSLVLSSRIGFNESCDVDTQYALSHSVVKMLQVIMYDLSTSQGRVTPVVIVQVRVYDLLKGLQA